MKYYKIIKSSHLKYNRITSIHILKQELNSFGFNYTIKDVKDILDKIINNLFTEQFDEKFKHCVDLIFSDNIYEELSKNNLYYNDLCFPENYIMPTAY